MSTSFIAELKRRNVIRIGMAYLVLSWVVLQIGDVLFEVLELPPDWGKATLAILVLGFIPTLVFSWVFELTPDGLKREADLTDDDRVHQAQSNQYTATKLNYLIVALLVVVIAQNWFMPNHPRVEPSATVEPVSPAESVYDKGVAVLPFENLSENQANAFFAGGVHEDVLTHLSRIKGLKVISRTSMLRVAEQKHDIPTIGKLMNVSHVLEGSVRRAGDRVRVTVQLIDAYTDEHIWAENYDRTLDDIFAIQTEVSITIAKQLSAAVSKEELELLSETPTTSTEAYDLYLKAKLEAQVWRAEKTFLSIIDFLEPAIELDPDFLLAKSMLVEAYGRIAWLGQDDDNIYAGKAQNLLNNIKATWPERPERFIAEGNYIYTVHKKYRSALESYYQALPFYPNDLDLISSISSSYKRLGLKAEHLYYAKKWYTLEPNSSTAMHEYLMALVHIEDYESAYLLVEKHKDILNCEDDYFCNDYVDIFSSYNQGDLDTFLSVLKTNQIDMSLHFFPDYHRAMVTVDQKKEAVAYLQSLINTASSPMNIFAGLELLIIQQASDPEQITNKSAELLNQFVNSSSYNSKDQLHINLVLLLSALANDEAVYEMALTESITNRRLETEHDDQLHNLTLNSAAKAVMLGAEIGWQQNLTRIDNVVKGLQMFDSTANVYASKYWYDFFFKDSASYQQFIKDNQK